MTVLSDPVLTLSGAAEEELEPLRPEDYDAEEPEKAEVVAVGGRQQVASLEGVSKLVTLLDAEQPLVLCDAANALYNLALLPANAEALRPALPKLAACLASSDHAPARAAAAGALMNVCATSARGRSDLMAAGLLPTLLSAVEPPATRGASPVPSPSSSSDASAVGERETRRNALGCLNNLLLDDDAAAGLREAGGIEVLLSLLREAAAAGSDAAASMVSLPVLSTEGSGTAAGETRLEDAASSLLRALQQDAPAAGEVLVAAEGLPTLVASLTLPNEELQVRAEPASAEPASAERGARYLPPCCPHRTALPTIHPIRSPPPSCAAHAPPS